MFIEAHKSKDEGGIALAFVKSTNIQAYPCGRRRANKSDDLYIPFDPEARLNTEHNNRKHSGLNGYTQTYVQSWKDQTVSLVLDNYLFTVKYTEDYSDAITASAAFGSSIIKKLTSIDETVKNAEKIYANILIEETPLYSSNTTTLNLDDYNTEILRNQSNTTNPTTSLDLFVGLPLDPELPSSYYFSGLSFSTEPLTGDNYLTRSTFLVERGGNLLPQRIVSLCILKKQYGSWQRYEPAYLPFIEHGDTPGSVRIQNLEAHSVETDILTAGTVFVPSSSGENQTLSAIKLESVGGPSAAEYFRMYISQATVE